MEGSGKAQLVQALQLINKRDSIFELATVVATNPLKIKLIESNIELLRSDLVVLDGALTYFTGVTSATLTNPNDALNVSYVKLLKNGDKLLVASIDNSQLFAVLGRVV